MLIKKNRLQKNKDFRRIYKKGKSKAYRSFVVYYRKNNRQDSFKIGFSVSKKIGKAVIRNLIKRRFRKACRNITDSFLPNYDYIFIVRKSATEMSFKQVQTEINLAVNNIKNLSV